LNRDPHSALYLSVPFCRTKCSFCNFASGVFSRDLLDRYIAHLEHAIAHAPSVAADCGAAFDPRLESVYLGGGTPSILAPEQLDRVFSAIGSTFDIATEAEITVEVAPGTLSAELITTLTRCAVNRVSLGVQSFIDQEARSVGRLHTREIALDDIRRLRQAGIGEISVDLIAGLPHQSLASWEQSLDEIIALELPHVSVYMLEVDTDSRLGRELLAGGARYHAHHVPDEALTVALYERACERLNRAGIAQYEISNFAREGHQSRHNLRYWRRLPYYGFGIDAHSMVEAPTATEPHRAVRLATPETLDALFGTARASGVAAGALAASGLADAAVPASWERTTISERHALEESYFLGLRLNCGVELGTLRREFGPAAVDGYGEVISDLAARGLVEVADGWLRLTAQGRLLSNEVFAAFLSS